MGVLTDGRRWVLRWPGADEVKTVKPYAFTLDSADHWFLLYQWLRDEALVSQENIPPDRTHIEEHFGPSNPSYQRDLAALHAIYSASSDCCSFTLRIRSYRPRSNLLAVIVWGYMPGPACSRRSSALYPRLS